MKIILVLIVSIFFIFLIRNNFLERFAEECPESCRNKIDETTNLLNTQSLNNNATNVQQLSFQMNSLSARVDENERKINNSLVLIQEVKKTIDEVKSNLMDKKGGD